MISREKKLSINPRLFVPTVTTRFFNRFHDSKISFNMIKLPQLQEDENEWFEREIHAHEPMLRSWLQSRFPSLSNVDDIIQDAFLRVLKINRKSRLVAPKAYLFSTSRNLAIDTLRREKVVKFKPLTGRENTDMLKNRTGIYDEIVQKEELEIITDAIKQLPQKCRRVVTLRKVYGMSAKQIAKRLNLSHRTVENQLLIGVKKCREYYTHLEGSLDRK